MQIRFNKIPKPAIACYCFGFLLLASAMIVYFYFPTLLPAVRVQQLFIGGAIIVAVGSVINTLYQFRSGKPNNKKE